MQAHLHLQMRLATKVGSIWTVSIMSQYLPVSREALAMFPEGKAGRLCWDSAHEERLQEVIALMYHLMTDSGKQCGWIAEKGQAVRMPDCSDMCLIWREGEHFAVNNKSSLLLVNDIYLQRFPLRFTDTSEKQRGPSSHPQGHWCPNFIWTSLVWRGRSAVPQWWQRYLLAFCQALGSCRQRCSSRFAKSSDRDAAAKKRLFLFTGRKKAI